jgi:hypothetical protein
LPDYYVKRIVSSSKQTNENKEQTMEVTTESKETRVIRTLGDMRTQSVKTMVKYLIDDDLPSIAHHYAREVEAINLAIETIESHYKLD